MDTPITHLLKQAIRRTALTQVEIVKSLGYTNLTKGCRRFNCHLEGTSRDRDFLIRLAEVLTIPADQLEVALEAADLQEKGIAAEAREAQRRADFARRGPHLWAILPQGYYPSLITIMGPAHFLLVPLPAEIVEWPEYEQLQEVREIVRAHFNDPNRGLQQVAGYWFRRAFDETFEFSIEGDFLRRKEGPAPVSNVGASLRGGVGSLRRAMGIPEF